MMRFGIKNMTKRMMKYAACYLIMIFVFVVLLTLVYMIPNEKIEYHREYSIYTLSAIEETWESFGNMFGLHSQPGMMDITTDRIMMTEALISDESMSALEAAVYMNGYTRYWHGYQVFLRPLLVVYQLHQIRYLNMFVFFGVFCLMLFALKKRTGMLSAIAFFLTMVCAYIVVIPMSMQYMPVFMVTMLAMLLILLRYPFCKRENLPLLFMIIGMTINFLDLLTTPIVTLCMPLLMCLYLEEKNGLKGLEAVKIALGCSVAWSMGYSLCWLAKWVLSSIVLKKNIFGEVTGKVQTWAIERDHSESRVGSVIRNFNDYFTFHGIRTMMFPLLFLALLMVCILLFRYKEKSRWACSGVMLAISLYPYIWYAVLMEHSWLHHWFTFRAQSVTQFGVYLAMIGMIDHNKMCVIAEALQKKGRCPNISKSE